MYLEKVAIWHNISYLAAALNPIEIIKTHPRIVPQTANESNAISGFGSKPAIKIRI